MPPNHKKQRGRDSQKKKEAQNAAQQHAAAVVRRAQLEAELQRKFGMPAVDTLIHDMAAVVVSKSSSHSSAEREEGVVCYHGSSAEQFVTGSGFLKTVKAHVSLRKKYDGGGFEQLGEANNKFLNNEEHKQHVSDMEFTNFVFALGVSLYLNLTVEEKEIYRRLEQTSGLEEMKQTPSYELEHILKLGLTLKYYMSPQTKGEKVDREQFSKYIRDVESERGIINCLYRETKNNCDCMKAKKIEANNMDKMCLCRGCRNFFPKARTMVCDGCEAVVYCSDECSVNDWPSHKPYCTNWQETETVRRMKNNDKKKRRNEKKKK